LILGIIVEQICALYYGIQLENVVDFYLNTTALFGPVAVLLILDLVIQRLQFQQHQKGLHDQSQQNSNEMCS
jgi:hypothetical protein